MSRTLRDTLPLPDDTNTSNPLRWIYVRSSTEGIVELPSEASIKKMWAYAEKYAEKSGTHLHPDRSITEAVILGLARNIDEYGRPICPCNFYPTKDENGSWPEGLYLPKDEEAKRRTWICACDEMQIYKYCHCLLFVTEEGLPITEYLPEDHEGREIYGLVKDPTPDKGRALAKALAKKQQAAEAAPNEG